eukprot:TRINITY_DN67881_c1_g10_i1.p1 TRINITY_DN67881_c1_g10~~TRINITY_DN67881_c1_g10_i1.p1  ORF type:complete len:202 (+),score=10.03 TRINITY_DN67881_c1_g10_i1:93-698(+)
MSEAQRAKLEQIRREVEDMRRDHANFAGEKKNLDKLEQLVTNKLAQIMRFPTEAEFEQLRTQYSLPPHPSWEDIRGAILKIMDDELVAGEYGGRPYKLKYRDELVTDTAWRLFDYIHNNHALPDSGALYLYGRKGSGKTTEAQQLAIAVKTLLPTTIPKTKPYHELRKTNLGGVLFEKVTTDNETYPPVVGCHQSRTSQLG